MQPLPVPAKVCQRPSETGSDTRLAGATRDTMQARQYLSLWHTIRFESWRYKHGSAPRAFFCAKNTVMPADSSHDARSVIAHFIDFCDT